MKKGPVGVQSERDVDVDAIYPEVLFLLIILHEIVYLPLDDGEAVGPIQMLLILFAYFFDCESQRRVILAIQRGLGSNMAR